MWYKIVLAITLLIAMTGCGSSSGGSGTSTKPGLAFTSTADVTVKEQITSVQTLSVENAEGVVEYSVSGGADQAKFTIKNNEELVFVTAPNYNPAEDDNQDHVYEVQIQAVDKVNGSVKSSTTQDKRITLDPLDKPVFTSEANINVPEYTTDVTVVNVVSKTAYTIVMDGVDSSLFDLNAADGSLSFKTAPKFAAPDDNNSDNVYEISLIATNIDGSTAQPMYITVTDVSGADLNITSAVYDDRTTADNSDDNLSIYFSVEIDPASLPSAIADAFDITGTGSIGTTTIYQYHTGWPYKLSIKLDATAVKPDENTQISIKANAIKVANGTPVETNAPATMEFALPIFATAQIQSYDENGAVIADGSLKDDGFYQFGLDRNVARDDVNKTVTDTINGLMWVDDSNVSTITKPWITQQNYFDENYLDQSGDTAKTYCENLTLAGYNDWRLPSIQELNTLIVKGTDPAYDNSFINVADGWYWSDTPCDECYQFSWAAQMVTGEIRAKDNYKYDLYHVRCVRSTQ